MLATGTISLLAACKFCLTGQRLAVARHQIRVSIGHLKTLAEVWVQAQRSLSEIQTIAREMLGQQTSQRKDVQLLKTSDRPDAHKPAFEAMAGVHQNSASDFFPQSSIEGLHAYFDLSDFCGDQTWVTEC